MNNNLTVKIAQLLTQTKSVNDALEAYLIFDAHEPGWAELALAPVV
jgi:hypothetical protein